MNIGHITLVQVAVVESVFVVLVHGLSLQDELVIFLFLLFLLVLVVWPWLRWFLDLLLLLIFHI